MLKFTTRPESEYIKAVRSGQPADLAFIKRFIDDPQNRDKTAEHFQALIIAITQKSLNIVELLTAKKAIKLYIPEKMHQVVESVARSEDMEILTHVLPQPEVKEFLRNADRTKHKYTFDLLNEMLQLQESQMIPTRRGAVININ